jgi:hypothetical protein
MKVRDIETGEVYTVLRTINPGWELHYVDATDRHGNPDVVSKWIYGRGIHEIENRHGHWAGILSFEDCEEVK